MIHHLKHHWHGTILLGAICTAAKSCRTSCIGETKLLHLHFQAAGLVQVAATRQESLKTGLGSQDWAARAAQEVAAARARGAQLPALVDRKQHRAQFLRMKAERAEAAASSKSHDSGLKEAAAAAKAEVPAQHLSAFSGMASVLSCDLYQEGNTRRGWCYLVAKMSWPHAVHVWLLLLLKSRAIDHCSLSFALSFVLHGRLIVLLLGPSSK